MVSPGSDCLWADLIVAAAPVHPFRTTRDVADVLSVQRYPIPSPTILFITPEHLRSLMEGILNEAQKSWLFRFAWRQKMAAAHEGFLTKDSLWDRLVFDNARAKVIGEAAGTLRSVIVSGGKVKGFESINSRLTFCRKNTCAVLNAGQSRLLHAVCEHVVTSYRRWTGPSISPARHARF